MFAAYALALVILLIVLRRVGGLEVPIWAAMCIGAALVLLAGAISPQAALDSIDFPLILFLFGTFAIARALEISGLLEDFAYKAFGRAENYSGLLIIILFGAGLLSAILMNDPFAVIGTPLVILMSRKLGMDPKPFLFALIFSITIGSALTPIGNPQNLLIATKSGMSAPFLAFAQYLLLPTLVNLAIAYFVLKLFYPDKEKGRKFGLNTNISMVRDSGLAFLGKLSVALFVLLIIARIVGGVLGFETLIPLPAIAIIGALPVLIFSKRRVEVARTLDWETLVLFCAMFVLMQAVWNEGLFQSILASLALDVKSIGVILAVSAVASQFVSNVPFAALYLPLLAAAGAGTKEFIALAAGSTLAGNLTPIGAASNLIILASAEKRGERISFFEFLKIGVVMTALNLLVVYIFLVLL
ncbi:MAG: SLC13 family permease [Candidatus Micrarchaeota archaeon]|nr:SLC13 family permease [Candidatus Micrarchaeota archaeon]